MRKDLRDKITRIINTHKRSTKGISVGITTGDETVYEYYDGVINRYRTRVSKDTMMGIGSNTKLLTTLGILLLEEKGLIDLDADISRYIPEFKPNSIYEEAPITIKNMFRHRSGLSDTIASIMFKIKKKDEIVPLVNDSYLINKPGKMYSYSNNAYELLGVIIERVSGMEYTTFIDTNIFKPLGLNMKYVYTEEGYKENKLVVSSGFDPSGKTVKDELSGFLSAGSNTFSDLRSLLQFMRMFLNPHSQNVIDPGLINRMKEDVDLDFIVEDERYHNMGMIHKGLLFEDYDVHSLGHGGATSSHFCLFDTIPMIDYGVVVHVNTKGSIFAAFRIQTEIFKVLLEESNYPKREKEETHQTFDEAYLGEYVAPMMTMEVLKKKDNLVYFKSGMGTFRMGNCINGYSKMIPIGKAKQAMKKSPLDRFEVKFTTHDNKQYMVRKRYLGAGYSIDNSWVKKDIRQIDFDPMFIVGTYTLLEEVEMKSLKQIELVYEDGLVIYKGVYDGMPFSEYYQFYDETKLIRMGSNRGSGFIMTVVREAGDVSIKFDGITYQRKNEKQDA